MDKTLKIRPYARLLTMLGEQLIKNEQIALAELIKNSYDADADWVKVRFVDFGFDEKKEEIFKTHDSKIIIEDNGCGMDINVIEESWMNPATPNKKTREGDEIKTTPKKHRIIQGEKGIGRFAILKLGRNITITTRPESQDIEYIIDYNLSKYDDDFLTEDRKEKKLFIDDIKQEKKLLAQLIGLKLNIIADLKKSTHIGGLDLLDGGVCLSVILGGQVEVGHIIINLIPVLGVREGLQESFESGDRLVERRIRLLIDRQRIVEEGLLLDVRVEIHTAGRLETEPGVGDILLLRIAGTQIEIGILAHGILDGGHRLQAGDRIFVVTGLVVGVTQHIHIVAYHLIRLLLICGEILHRVRIVLLRIVALAQNSMDLLIVRILRVILKQLLTRCQDLIVAFLRIVDLENIVRDDARVVGIGLQLLEDRKRLLVILGQIVGVGFVVIGRHIVLGLTAQQPREGVLRTLYLLTLQQGVTLLEEVIGRLAVGKEIHVALVERLNGLLVEPLVVKVGS